MIKEEKVNVFFVFFVKALKKFSKIWEKLV